MFSSLSHLVCHDHPCQLAYTIVISHGEKKMNRVSSIIHLPYAKKQNLTGRGITIAILDTGLGPHPDLFTQENPSRVLCFIDFVSGKSKCYDDNGHGTHVAGIIGGTGKLNAKYAGIAPNCNFVILKVLNHKGDGKIDHMLKALKWLYQNHKKYNIQIVNISVGSTQNHYYGETSPLVHNVNALWSQGIVVFCAAGNHGPGIGSIGAPGNSRKIITVGSSDPLQYPFTNDYSSRGPTTNCIKKPDIVAPGSNIVSCHPAFPPKPADYQARSGTSMSTPILSGCTALLLEQNHKITNKEVKMRLKSSALDLGYEHSRQGWGLLQCDRFLRH